MLILITNHNVTHYSYVKYQICKLRNKKKTEGDINLMTCIEAFIILYFTVNRQNQQKTFFLSFWGWSWSWSYGSWIYDYLCNQCWSPLTLWVQIPLRQCVLDTTLCAKVWQWLATGLWFSPCTSVSFTNKTDRHDITEILLKVAFKTR